MGWGMRDGFEDGAAPLQKFLYLKWRVLVASEACALILTLVFRSNNRATQNTITVQAYTYQPKMLINGKVYIALCTLFTGNGAQ